MIIKKNDLLIELIQGNCFPLQIVQKDVLAIEIAKQ
jgi:hypothetical protein